MGKHPLPENPHAELGDRQLGIVAKSVSPSRRVERYQLQTYAARLLPDFRVSYCYKRPRSSDGVVVVYHPGHAHASYSGLMSCGSVWTCPVCSSKISERRRLELAAAIEEWESRGGRVLLVTVTVRHKRGDNLGQTLAGLQDARQRLRRGKAAVTFDTRFGVAGHVTALEVTWGASGWHPHAHSLWFVGGDVDSQEFEAKLAGMWTKAVGAAGLRDVNDHGCTVQPASGAVGDYVAKFGTWDAAAELAKGATKQGRVRGRSPFALLRDYGEHGDREAGRLFQEYARVFKGRRQLFWSRGLRKLLGLGVERTDEQVAEETTAHGDELLTLDSEQWAVVAGQARGCDGVRRDRRGELLDIAARGDVREVVAYLLLEVQRVPWEQVAGLFERPG